MTKHPNSQVVFPEGIPVSDTLRRGPASGPVRSRSLNMVHIREEKMAVLVIHRLRRQAATKVACHVEKTVVKLIGVKSKSASLHYTVENEPERGSNASEMAVNNGLYVTRPTQLCQPSSLCDSWLVCLNWWQPLHENVILFIQVTKKVYLFMRFI